MAFVQSIYHGFIRKPSTEHPASIGRRRQERCYSDSENSYSKDVPVRSSRGKLKYFNVQSQEDYHWGRQPLWQGLATEQVENLVAWAHHGTEPPNAQSSFLDPTMPTEMVSLLQESLASHDPKTRNPLIDYVNTPLPLSFLNYMALRAEQIPEVSDGLRESFDDSALVATGMMLEEIITASLLPLAGLHALRCQQLEARPSKDEALLAPVTQVSLTHPITNQPIQFDTRHLPDDESAFNAWTLPPEEAISKLATQGMIPDTGVPLIHDPIRSCQSATSDKAFHISTNKEVVEKIFRTLRIDLKRHNQEYLNLFLSKEGEKKRPAPVEVTDNHNQEASDGPSQPFHKRIRMTEV